MDQMAGTHTATRKPAWQRMRHLLSGRIIDSLIIHITRTHVEPPYQSADQPGNDEDNARV